VTLLPVIARELRAEARRPFTCWLRVLGLSVVLLQAVLQIPARGLAIRQGALFLFQIQATLFAAIWVLVPLETADCISRDRREGTLGLLFLPPAGLESFQSAGCRPEPASRPRHPQFKQPLNGSRRRGCDTRQGR